MIKLTSGDKVALIAPASGQKTQQVDLIDAAIARLSDWGLSVVIRPQLAADSGYLAAADEVRANSLIDALTHPEVKAVFTTRGGYGCARIIPYLNKVAIDIPSPRWLLGFSDITTLHLHFTRQMTHNLHCVHAPNLATGQFLDETAAATKNRSMLYHFLFDACYPAFCQPVAANLAATQLTVVDWHNQPKTGGCLSLLVTSLGTPYEVITKDKWLLIEEIAETPYKVDRMLMHLENAGKFDDVRGVVLGEMVRCNSRQINNQAVIDDLADRLACPVLSLPCFGHGEINLPWRYATSLATVMKQHNATANVG